MAYEGVVRPTPEFFQSNPCFRSIFINNELCSSVIIPNNNNVNSNNTNVATTSSFATYDPATERVLVSDVPCGNASDVDSVVRAARSAFRPGSAWRSCNGPARGRLLHRLADLLARDADVVAGIEAADSGKPAKMARLADVNSAVAVLRAHAGFCYGGSDAGRQLPVGDDDGSTLCYTRKEPVGVVAAILPFNFPLCGAVAKLAPALAAGCTVVVKPSERCPLSPMWLCGRLIAEAGFPPGVVNCVPGDGVTTGKALVEHPGVDKVSFTGSTAVGKRIVGSSMVDRLARVTLELGGKNPCIVCPNILNLERAAKIATGGNFFNCGQICVGISRVLIPERNYDDFVERVRRRAEALIVGDPFAEGTEMGPLVDEVQRTRVLDYVARAVAQGARLVCGGRRVGATGRFVAPTVLADVTDDNVVAHEEIFGPVLCCQRYSGDVDEAVRRANATPFGLAAVVVSDDVNEAVNVAHRLDAGTVWINTHGVFDPVAPYQGRKQSGIGQEYGVEGLDAYYATKTVMINTSP